MSDEVTPLILGDAAAAELGARPGRKWRRRKKKKAQPPLTHCENCGVALTGPFCAQCGQPAIDYHRSFGSLMADAADAFFNIDARFFQSFGLLLFKPWRLTNEFIAGKRARHVHPLRVYLIASVLFFLVINYLARDSHLQSEPEREIKQKAAAAGAPSATPAASLAPTVAPRNGISFSKLPPKRAPGEVGQFQFTFDDKHSNQPKTGLNGWIERRAREKLGPSGNRADLFLRGVIQNLAPMVLCCIPLFAFVLKLLYFFKRRFYIEHLIFALHTHAFVFISTVIIIGLGFLLALQSPVLTAIFCPLLSFVVLGQLLVAIRRVYRQNWFATIFKFLLGSVIYLIVLSLAFGVTATVTLILP